MKKNVSLECTELASAEVKNTIIKGTVVVAVKREDQYICYQCVQYEAGAGH